MEFDRGTHICHLFENPVEQEAVVLHVLSAGLALGDQVALISPDETVNDWYSRLAAAGMDVCEERRRGALMVVEATTWHPGGELNSVLMARRLSQMIAAAVRDFTGVRMVVDMSWVLEPPLPADQLCHWEATGNLVLEDTSAYAICQYDLSRHAPAVIHNAFRTHPLILFEGRLMPSPWYEAPNILKHEPHLNSSSADAEQVEAMLARLRALAN